MTWIAEVTESYEGAQIPSGCASRPRFHPPASREGIDVAERDLQLTFPTSLRGLLEETDGVMSMLSVGGAGGTEMWFEDQWLVWPVARIVQENRSPVSADLETGPRPMAEVRSRYLFFASAGVDGILFGFPRGSPGGCLESVVSWNPLGDTIPTAAESLDRWIAGWLNGSIAV